ncbi:hypothetical protein JCM6882_001426 [Rhodosporidiobolus microsporus]
MADAPVTFIKKRKGAPSGLRKKDTAATAADETGGSEVVRADKRGVTSHLVQGTGNKRRKTEDLGPLSDSDDEKDKERKSFAVRHSSNRAAMRRRSESPPAWVSTEQIKEMARDKNALPEEAKEDGLYHGSKGEKHQVPKAFGPVKGGPANVRTITLVDYQPDVCKDYKETGFCGFGDTCKFLHDRGDYLHGWQLDNSFLSNSAASGSFMAKQKAREGDDDGSDDDSENEDLPFACLICRKPFGPDPVVTLCGHYFDSACAIKRFSKTGKCFACGTSTNGVFNRATKIIAKEKERETLNKKAREEEEGDGGDGGEGIEIEGLGEGAAEEEEAEEEDPHVSRRRRARDEEEEEDEDEEEDERPRRRPIIEIQ